MFAAAGTEQENVHKQARIDAGSPSRAQVGDALNSPLPQGGWRYWRSARPVCPRHSQPKAFTAQDIQSQAIQSENQDCFAEAAMISCNVATWRANAPRPAAVAVTVVCGFLPTKAFSTAT